MHFSKFLATTTPCTAQYDGLVPNGTCDTKQGHTTDHNILQWVGGKNTATCGPYCCINIPSSLAVGMILK